MCRQQILINLILWFNSREASCLNMIFSLTFTLITYEIYYFNPLQEKTTGNQCSLHSLSLLSSCKLLIVMVHAFASEHNSSNRSIFIQLNAPATRGKLHQLVFNDWIIILDMTKTNLLQTASTGLYHQFLSTNLVNFVAILPLLRLLMVILYFLRMSWKRLNFVSN